VKLSSLSVEQLSQVKKSLDDEIQHLTQSFQSLRLAQSKFRDCLKSLSAGLSPKLADRSILVPLTSSLYVPGNLADTERVIVDVGTGFYVEKSIKDAEKFYDRKVQDLDAKLIDLEKVIQSKGQSLAVVEDEIRRKVVSQNAGEGSAAAA
ncbi:Prefoldin alpha subunit, partial [Rhizodiscina lignyota]